MSLPSQSGVRPRCAVLGEALVDRLPQGPVLGGAPFNVARNLAALGGPPLLITRIGLDADGERIAAACRRFGLPDEGVQRDASLPTGSVDVLIDAEGHRFVMGRNQAWDAIDAADACAAVLRAEPELIYFGCLAQREAASRQAIRAVLDATQAVRFLDLNLREGADAPELLRESIDRAHVLKVNEEELSRVLDAVVTPGAGGLRRGCSAQRSVIAEFMRRTRLRRLIVTRGASGYAAFDSEGRAVFEGPSPAVSVIDTVGAGDAFTSICMIGLVHAWPLEQTLARAADFAAGVCTLPGAVTEDAGFYAAWRERFGLAVQAPPSQEPS